MNEDMNTVKNAIGIIGKWCYLFLKGVFEVMVKIGKGILVFVSALAEAMFGDKPKKRDRSKK